MSFKVSRGGHPSKDAAEALAAQALGFLASDAQRLVSFLGASGLEIADLRARAGTPEFLTAVLDYVVRDESLLLVFAAEAGAKPETVVLAHHVLAGDLPG